MRLAANSFTLRLGDKSFDLKPSLRAAFDLNLKYDGFNNLSLSIAEGSLTAAIDLITWTVVNKATWAAYGLAPDGSLIHDVMAARDQLLDLVLALTGNDQGNEKSQTGETISFEEYFTQLYQLGTGWLGWSPADTWDATPAEIINAQQGRIAMLKAIFGGKSDDQADVAGGSLASIKGSLNALGDLTNNVLGSR
jgi:hypothetical protein